MSATIGGRRPSPEEYEEVRMILESVGTIDPLDKAEEFPLIQRAKAGDREAMHRLIQAHLRGILQIASQQGSQTVPLPDRVQDGIEGLIDAVKRYDDDTGQIPLLAFAKHRVRYHTQREERSYREPAVDPDLMADTAMNDALLEAIESELSSDTLRRIMDVGLSRLEKAVVDTLYLSDNPQSPKEFAATHGITEEELEAVRRRALARLRSLWVPGEGDTVQGEYGDDEEEEPGSEEFGLELLDPRQIVVGDRLREDLGQISELADSLRAVGMLNPITITEDNRLVAGRRRLEAAMLLRWRKVPVRRIHLGGRTDAGV